MARFALAAAAILLAAASAPLACSSGGSCTETGCPTGETCNRALGVCKASTRHSPSKCAGGCSGDTPMCDEATGKCAVCTTFGGCGSARPYCDTSVSLGRCVACKSSASCPSQTTCDVDAGSCVESADGGAVGACVPSKPVACTGECPHGFTCVDGFCALDGGSGALQVTLRWNRAVDLDLHLTEPTPNGPCEIFYGSALVSPDCSPEGKLDLDSNAGCFIDGKDLENIIYPADQAAPKGAYSVSVVYYERCQNAEVVKYEVDVRIGAAVQTFCGSFAPTEPGTARQITSFVLQ